MTNSETYVSQLPKQNPNQLAFLDNGKTKFLSEKNFQSWLDQQEQTSRVLTIEGVTAELVGMSELAGNEPMRWKPCLKFKEITKLLVIKAPQAEQLEHLSCSNSFTAWGKLGQICLSLRSTEGRLEFHIEAAPPFLY